MSRSLKPITILRRARALIADPKRWIKGAYMRNKKVGPCYCLGGALNVASGNEVNLQDVKYKEKRNKDALNTAAKFVQRVTRQQWIPEFNDSIFTFHSDVLKALDKAIALAKAA